MVFVALTPLSEFCPGHTGRVGQPELLDLLFERGG
jgi:hypothetical protein